MTEQQAADIVTAVQLIASTIHLWSVLCGIYVVLMVLVAITKD